MMDFTTIRAGDQIEPAVVGHRVWRYRLAPLRLYSFCLGDTAVWPADEPYQSDKEPNEGCANMQHGIHAFRTLEGLRGYFRDLRGQLKYRDISGDGLPWHGIVRGTVRLWGVCIDHEHGYRAQYARPISFDEIYGDKTEYVLPRLRRMFCHCRALEPKP
jgi:hypothetical protein